MPPTETPEAQEAPEQQQPQPEVQETPAAPPQGQEPEDEEFTLEEGRSVFPREYVEKLRTQEARNRTRRREIEEKVKGWGPEEEIEQAVNLWRLASTSDGLAQIFLEAGERLGLSIDQLQALASGQAPQKGTEAEEEEDRPLTAKEIRELIEREVRQPLTARQEEQTIRQNRAAIDSALSELGVTQESYGEHYARVRNAVLEFGESYVSPEESDPAKLVAAVRRGHADFQSLLEKQAQSYLAKKANGQPASALTGGAPPTSAEMPEPQNVREAHVRLRERLKAAGQL